MPRSTMSPAGSSAPAPDAASRQAPARRSAWPGASTRSADGTGRALGDRPPRIVYAVTSPRVSWWLQRGQLAFVRLSGADVHLVSSPEPLLEATAEREGVAWHAVPMAREIAPAADLRALAALWRLFRRLRPDLVNVSTPKAGLVGGLAALLAGVPARVYVLRGLRLETTRGLLRVVLWLAERAACGSASVVVCVSPSLRERALALRLVRPGKARVIGAGSSNGVEVERFAPSPGLLARAERLRGELGLEQGGPVVGFVGRFTRDKGMVELAEAFQRVRARIPSARLLLVGDYEEGDPVPEATRRQLEGPGVVRAGWVADTSPYFHLCDVVALPTHREGFPNTAVEAAAAGKPVVTTDATGARDAVVHGETGLVVPTGDAAALAAALEWLLEDPAWARSLGQRGRELAIERYRPESVWQGLLSLYRELYRREARPKRRPSRALGRG